MTHDTSLIDLRERCVRQAVRSAHLAIRTWIPEPFLVESFARSVTDVLSWIGDPAFATGFQDAMPVVGAILEDYWPSVLTLGQDQSLVAGIRFRSQPGFSFVAVYARDFPLEHHETVTAMLNTVGHRFSMFSPAYLQVHAAVKSAEDAVLEMFPGRIDFVTVAGPVAGLQHRQPPPNMERVRLEPATTEAFYHQYVAEYEAFHRVNPHLRELVPIASQETLDHSHGQNLLYQAFVDGEWAGIVAGRLQENVGMTGYCLVEEVLAARFRGLKLGPALQRHFIDALSPADRFVLHGAIDPANAPSLATAKRVGRVEVMRAHLIELAPTDKIFSH